VNLLGIPYSSPDVIQLQSNRCRWTAPAPRRRYALGSPGPLPRFGSRPGRTSCQLEVLLTEIEWSSGPAIHYPGCNGSTNGRLVTGRLTGHGPPFASGAFGLLAALIVQLSLRGYTERRQGTPPRSHERAWWGSLTITVRRPATNDPGIISEQGKGVTDLVQHVVSVLQQDRYPVELCTQAVKAVMEISRHGINAMPQSVEIKRGPPVDTVHDVTHEAERIPVRREWEQEPRHAEREPAVGQPGQCFLQHWWSGRVG
jgi:hypothetical protein